MGGKIGYEQNLREEHKLSQQVSKSISPASSSIIHQCILMNSYCAPHTLLHTGETMTCSTTVVRLLEFWS